MKGELKRALMRMRRPALEVRATPDRRRSVGLVPLSPLAFALLSNPLLGQSDAALLELADPFEPENFGNDPYEEMSALLEVTIFNIDVLVLTVRVGPETGARLQAVTEGHDEYSDELGDSVAAIILEADEAWARQVFKRGVGLDRLMGGMRETSEKAAEAGFISREYADEFAANLPAWFRFLQEEDGAKEGDAIYFLVRGNEVRTVYRTVDGRVLMDEVGVTAEGRRGSIPSFFAPNTRFRKRLVESLLGGS
jgi:hypothetical protein